MLLHKEMTDEILNAFYEVYKELGYKRYYPGIKSLRGHPGRAYTTITKLPESQRY